MKRTDFFVMMFILLAVPSVFAKKTETAAGEKDTYEYNNIVSMLDKVSPPIVTDNYIIFTQKTGPRFIGIAFDHENYQTVHRFQNHINKDFDGNVTGSMMFYLLERPAKLTSIKYRLVIDGLWTADPENPEHVYDEKTGISLSMIRTGSVLPEITNTEKNDTVKFIYNGKPGKRVRLAGSFTNWDSWIYELSETAPGCYELEIPLPAGKYYYNYYLGMQAVVDSTNPERAYTADGRTASVIVVN